jgi:hypothetical protein
MAVVSLINICIPYPPVSAAAEVTLKSPPPVVDEDQEEKLPFSKPSAKIRSDTAEVGEGVNVKVGSGVLVGVLVEVGV